MPPLNLRDANSISAYWTQVKFNRQNFMSYAHHLISFGCLDLYLFHPFHFLHCASHKEARGRQKPVWSDNHSKLLWLKILIQDQYCPFSRLSWHPLIISDGSWTWGTSFRGFSSHMILRCTFRSKFTKPQQPVNIKISSSSMTLERTKSKHKVQKGPWRAFELKAFMIFIDKNLTFL